MPAAPVFHSVIALLRLALLFGVLILALALVLVLVVVLVTIIVFA